MKTSIGRRGFTLIELLVVIAIIGILAAIIFPVFGRARDKARETQCIANQKQIALVALMMADDNGEKFPTGTNLWKSVGGKVTACPSDPSLENGYGYNSYVQGVKMGDVGSPDFVILTADANEDAGNLLVNPEDLDARHGSDTIIYSYADGHVERGGPRPFVPENGTTQPMLDGMPLGNLNDVGSWLSIGDSANKMFDVYYVGAPGASQVVNISTPEGATTAIQTDGDEYISFGMHGAYNRAVKNAKSSTWMMSFYYKGSSDGTEPTTTGGGSRYSVMLTDGMASQGTVGPDGNYWGHDVWDCGLVEFSRKDVMRTAIAEAGVGMLGSVPGYAAADITQEGLGTHYLTDGTYFNCVPLNPTNWIDPVSGVETGVLWGAENQDLTANYTENMYRAEYYAEWHKVSFLVKSAFDMYCYFGNDDMVKSPYPLRGQLYVFGIVTAGSGHTMQWDAPRALAIQSANAGLTQRNYLADLKFTCL